MEINNAVSGPLHVETVLESEFIGYLNDVLIPFGARATFNSNYGSVPVRTASYNLLGFGPCD